MEGSKPWYKSVGMWAGIISTLTGLASVAADVALQTDTANWVVQVIGVVNGGIMLYGRWRAVKIIK